MAESVQINIRAPVGLTLSAERGAPVANLPETSTAEHEALNRWERTGAGALATAALVAGGLATFRSENEAGTVALVLVGGALSILAIQGTPLVKVGGDKGSMDLERRRRVRVAETVDRVRAEEGSEKAAALADELVAIDPDLAQMAEVGGVQYEATILNALDRVAGNVVEKSQWGPDSAYDALVTRPGGLRVGIEVIFRRSGRLTLSTAQRAIYKMQAWQGAVELQLIASNVPASNDLLHYLQEQPRMRFVRWRGPEDDERLLASLMS